MASGTPIIRQISWPGLLLQISVMLASLVAMDWWLGPGKGAAPALALYLCYSMGSRSLLARHHRRGMALVRQGKFDDAIAAHEASYAFFQRQEWIDRYRAVTMMSPSAISYREMALVNIAYCHAQAGRGAKAKEGYERALEQFPGSGIATAGLNMLKSMTPGE